MIMEHTQDSSVYQLITELCIKTASKHLLESRITQKRLISKMRSNAFEIILRKSNKELMYSTNEPIADLLSYYFVLQQNAKNVAEYKRSVQLKEIIGFLRTVDFGVNCENINNILSFLVSLSNTVKQDLSSEIFKSPFTFGTLDRMLPKPEPVPFGSVQPYPYYPSHIFELPFSLKCQGALLEIHKSQTNTEKNTVKSFDSHSLLLGNVSQVHGAVQIQTFISPMSLVSLTSTHLSPYSENAMKNCTGVTAPRDLQIPSTKPADSEIRVSIASSNVKSDMRQLFRAKTDGESIDIWEIASQMDKDLPGDIWELVSKMPPINERRQLIASSSREMRLWRETYGGALSDLHLVSERQFIRHIMYLIIGVETSSFPYNEEHKCFFMTDKLALECISLERLRGYVSSLLTVGTHYRRLYNFAFGHGSDGQPNDNGLVYEAAREVMRRFLLEFRLSATAIYEECCRSGADDAGCMPTLLQILFHMEPLKHEIETVASIYKTESLTTIPRGGELVTYLFNEISLVTHKKSALTLFNSLFTICKVYFKFIERFIFEGELDDRYNEFFIRKDAQYVNCRAKRYWDRGFHITHSLDNIPEFLRSLAKLILLCGKSLRLLKLCNPNDPLILLISSDHPSVKCCASFEELERQQQVLDVYRTRCLFVSGEPVTFNQILLKRDAEKKAFAEVASMKQAETMEKIRAERKRLGQLIIAGKQHSLRVLEAAMAEAKAAKKKAKERERKRYQLERNAEAITEEVDSRLIDDERNKIMEYYSKLNMAVEKSKIHTEWKIKRLQLDQSRIQLLSTEERNLKREKLELEHQKNEAIMAMSLQSLDSKGDDDKVINDNDATTENDVNQMTDSVSSVVMEETREGLKGINEATMDDKNGEPHQTNVVLTALCNAAKSIFRVPWTHESKNCDNIKELDSQGNIVPVMDDVNSNEHKGKTSSDVIGGQLNNAFDNTQYLKMREEALINKKKVMSHEMGQTDLENNQLKDRWHTKLDDENNDVTSAFSEAKRNKLKVLGADFDMIKTEESKNTVVIPRTDAQKEALINKQKVLGVEYNIPLGPKIPKEPANIAQQEAVRNMNKVLGSEYGKFTSQATTRDLAKRSGLTLDLKPQSETSTGTYNVRVTPNTGAVTPAEFFPQLDLETPTTEIAPDSRDGPLTSDIFSPNSEGDKEVDGRKTKSDKQFISDSFDFSIIEDEETADPIIHVKLEDSPDNSPFRSWKNEIKHLKTKRSFLNIADGSYSLEDFDPFKVKQLKRYTKDHFTNEMDLEMKESCYMHPSIILDEVKKAPYSNIFESHFALEDDDRKINCDNIVTLTACLQRSVMLPLTYQLEVVNNAILTYFLVNLDMYEHLRSLKDYFFLMDGDFSRSICRNLFSKMSQTLNPQELVNFATLHNILDKALGSSILHNHKLSERLSFTISEPPLSWRHGAPDALRCVSLSYAVAWPLDALLSPDALLRYARVFQYLIKMRRVAWLLAQDFENLKLSVKLAGRNSRKLLKSPQYRSVQIYRHVMAAMMRALDHYIVTTCVLKSWTEFETELRKARTLDDLYDCHVVYIKNVLFRCLLNNRSTPVMKLLNNIFTVILKFSRLLKAGQWQQNDDGIFTHTCFAQLQEVFHLFEKLNKYLHKVITRLMECGYQRHLAELLTMVNFNGYYDPDRGEEEQNTSLQVTGDISVDDK